MTKSQIWIASLLLLFLILFGISQLTHKETENTGVNNIPGSGNSGETNTQTALTLIKTNGCTSCHGVDLKGTEMAPSLSGVKQLWSSRDDLINYLRNPSSFMDKERFTKYREKYKRVVMPSFNNLDVKDLGKIADYIRSL
jgi:cytochrome c551/c552